MKKTTKMISMFFTITFFFFCSCFSGCVVFSTGGDSDANAGKHPDVENSTFQEQEQTQEEKIDYSDIYRQGYYDNMKDGYYGVRAVYYPKIDSTYTVTPNNELNSDRSYFNQIVLSQYQTISTYILYELLGEYAVYTQNDLTLNIDSLDKLPDSDDYDTVFVAPNLSPKTVNTSIYYVNNFAIEYSIDGVSLNTNGSDCTFVANKNWDCGWECKLYDESSFVDTDYVNKYLVKYVPFLQLRLIEVEYNLPATTLSSYNQKSPTAIEQILNTYLLHIDKLGVNCSSDMIGDVISIVKDEIIGRNAINRETSALNLREKFAWEYEDEEHNIQTQTADIDLNGDGVYGSDGTDYIHTEGTPNDIYKYKYADTVARIVGEVYSGVANRFPTLDRRECVDIDAGCFFEPGTKGQNGAINHLDNMDYQEYQSAVAYNKDVYFPIALQLSIDSVSDLEMGIYIRICHNGSTHIWYLGTMHTDSTKSFNTEYESTDSETTIDPNTVVSNTMAWQISDIIENGAQSEDELADYVREYYNSGLSANESSSLNVNSGCYKPTMLYSGTIYDNYSYCLESVVNKADADLSNLWVFNDTSKDFVELIFDVTKDDTTQDKNYDFKFIFEVIDGNTDTQTVE